MPLGRRFRALKLWFVLRTYGRAGLQAYLRHHLALAASVEARLRADARFELAAPPRFALVCFRLKAPGPLVAQGSIRLGQMQLAPGTHGAKGHSLRANFSMLLIVVVSAPLACALPCVTCL